ncbi:MAG: glycosyltransferase family 4 protein [Anaerolineae bacterium]|nr:glycosyltransferase family 4 protein [Anaerolineae bacterium]
MYRKNSLLKKIPLYLKAADLFGFASTSETQGLVTMEALAAGLPVVAVNATGTRDVIRHDLDGILTEDDPEALGQAIGNLLADETFYQKMKLAAKHRAKDFDLTRQSQRLIELYGEAIEDKQANRTVTVPKAKTLINMALETGPLKQVRDLITEIRRE